MPHACAESYHDGGVQGTRAACYASIQQRRFLVLGERNSDLILAVEHLDIRLDVSPQTVLAKDGPESSKLQVDCFGCCPLGLAFCLIVGDAVSGDVGQQQVPEHGLQML